MRVERKYAAVVWLVATLIGIALVGMSPLLGFGVAVVGGVLFGVVAWLGWNEKRR